MRDLKRDVVSMDDFLSMRTRAIEAEKRVKVLEEALALCEEAFRKQLSMRMFIGEPAYIIARNTMEELASRNALKGSDKE